MYSKRQRGGFAKLKRPLQKGPHKRRARWAKELAAIEKVQRSIQELRPQSVTSFRHIPLSPFTQEGLASAGFTAPTDVQREALPIALKGEDVLGTAKTGNCNGYISNSII